MTSKIPIQNVTAEDLLEELFLYEIFNLLEIVLKERLAGDSNLMDINDLATAELILEILKKRKGGE